MFLPSDSGGSAKSNISVDRLAIDIDKGLGNISIKNSSSSLVNTAPDNLYNFGLAKLLISQGNNLNSLKYSKELKIGISPSQIEVLGKEIAATREGDNMGEEKYYETIINKLDEDRRHLQQEFKERESRIERQIENSEKRVDSKFDKIENLILMQNNKIESLINEQNNKIDTLKDEVRNQLSEDKKYRHTNNIAIVIGVVTTVIALISIYYATVSMITDLLGLVK